MFKRVGVLCALCSAGAWGQHLSYGVVAGSALTADFNSFSLLAPYDRGSIIWKPEHQSFPIGGAFWEWNFSSRFSIQGQGLYRAFHYNETKLPLPTSHNTVLTWELPVLAKYELPLHTERLRPFLDAGPSFRAHGNLNVTNPSRAGFSAGAGLQFRIRKLGVAPTLRYTRWNKDRSCILATRQDQIELLIELKYIRQLTHP